MSMKQLWWVTCSPVSSEALGRTNSHLDSISVDWRVALCPHTHSTADRTAASVLQEELMIKPKLLPLSSL